MLLSHQPAFLFVHIEKAAGSSIQIALRPLVAPGVKDRHWRRRLVWLGRLNRLGSWRLLAFPEHAPASLAQGCLPEAVFNGLFKFAFVRNPWDRVVSRYAHLLRSTDRRRHQMVRRMEKFEDFVAWEIQRGAFQYKYVTDRNGRSIVDFVGHYERVTEDFAAVCARLGVKASLPHANVSRHEDYRTYYTPATRDLVARHFARDIELFGYDFDGLSANNPGAFRPANCQPEPQATRL